MNYKQRFPSSESLKTAIKNEWGNLTNDVLFAAGESEQKRRESRGWLYILGSLWLVVFTVLFFAITSDFAWARILEWGVLFSLIFLVPLSGKHMRQYLNANIDFNYAVNRVLYPRVFALLGLPLPTLSWSLPESEVESGSTQLERDYTPYSLLNASQLVTVPRNNTKHDNAVVTSVNGRRLAMCEFDITNVIKTRKYKKVTPVFRGLFFVYDLKQTFTGKTFISTEGDESGFGHTGFWGRLSHDYEKLVETKLEWNDFEDLLHVATTDEREAREILTPDFMEDLHNWWLDKPGNIRISIIENRMYILLPDPMVRIRQTVPSPSTEELQDYAYTIAAPLVHALHLVEDVK